MAGVQHHVLLSIVGIDHGQAVAHYAGKREQERLVTSGPVPWTIVRATQFHDFAAMTAEWAAQDGVATVAPLLVQPIDPADVAAQPWRTCMISGTPEYVANLLNTYQDAGVDRFALWMPGPDMTGSMQRFVDQVRPLLR